MTITFQVEKKVGQELSKLIWQALVNLETYERMKENNEFTAEKREKHKDHVQFYLDKFETMLNLYINRVEPKMQEIYNRILPHYPQSLEEMD